MVDEPNRPYRVVALCATHLELCVLRACTARELAGALFGSKAACRQAFARGVLAPGAHFEPGDTVRIAFTEPAHLPLASDKPVEVVWHDRLVLAANKPAGLLVHADGTAAPTLAARVQGWLAREAALQGWPYVPAAQALNRLDVKTSGIVLFSLAKEFQSAFDALVADHTLLHKRYLAVATGSFPTGTTLIDASLARDRHDARRMRVGSTGKPARTRVACVDRALGTSLVACELESGRKHQIRVHMAHAGHPLVGDELYGRARPRDPLMLHAAEVEFVHPITCENIRLVTDWPARFASLYSARTVDWSILFRN